jgi:hypothetical protein
MGITPRIDLGMQPLSGSAKQLLDDLERDGFSVGSTEMNIF